jgi:hypothetical protein
LATRRQRRLPDLYPALGIGLAVAVGLALWLTVIAVVVWLL